MRAPRGICISCVLTLGVIGALGIVVIVSWAFG